MTRLQTICVGTPAGDRLNEDAYFLAEDGHFVLMAAIDGVTDRLKSDALCVHFESHFPGEVNGSRYAALAVREALMTSYWYKSAQTPGDLLIAANDHLRGRVQSAYGTFSPTAIFRREPALAAYHDDERYFRLIIPACVATIARVNLQSNALEYAHLGDTELLLFHTDGRTERVIAPIRPNASAAVPDVSAESDPQVAKYKRVGLFHNFTDTNGQTDSTVGVGVVNGMPQARDYLLTGRISLDGVVGVLVCSDGFMWPQPAGESADAEATRYAHMRALIEREGVAAYVDHLRAEEAADADRTRYPRPKTHDDATALYLAL